MSNLSSSINPSFNQSNLYTRLNDPELTDIITHINEEHIDELLGLFRTFISVPTAQKNNVNVILNDIYAEGLALKTIPKQLENQHSNFTEKLTEKEANNPHSDEQIFFIPFESPIQQLDELQIQYIYLRQKVDKKLGKKTIKLTQQTFSVLNSYKVSDHMLRVELSMPKKALLRNDGLQDFETKVSDYSNSVNPIPTVPTQDAGYAYLFDLDHNFEARQHLKAKIDTPRSHCYYTLRKAWTSDTGTQAWVDIFLHGTTSGGVWASSLQPGDTVISKREFPEKIEHLRDGQALLIADETSMPTVARLLELWQNSLPPLVICVTQDEADQAYLKNVEINNTIKDRVTIVPLVTGKANSGKDLAFSIDNVLRDYLASHDLKIEKVWGGLEAATAKTLRGLLKQRLKLERSDMVVKVYWRENT